MWLFIRGLCIWWILKIDLNLLFYCLIKQQPIMNSLHELSSALDEVEHKNPLVFTRYLYSKEEVKHSLLIALLEKDLDESLYWTYELYHSGFQEELWLYIESIYEVFYKLTNPAALGKCLEDLYKKWCADNSEHRLFGSMIKNLIMRPYNVNQFIESYMGVKCEPIAPEPKEGKFLRVNLSAEDVIKYETLAPEYQKARFVLAKAYRYAIRKNVGALFHCSRPDTKEQYRYHWEYYCWDCPYWRSIMDAHNCEINHETKRIDFDEESDDFDDFYDHYGYEPDEQNSAVQAMSIGKGDEIQMTIKDFADRYGGTMVKRTIRLSRK